jgi:hypothetical protein
MLEALSGPCTQRPRSRRTPVSSAGEAGRRPQSLHSTSAGPTFGAVPAAGFASSCASYSCSGARCCTIAAAQFDLGTAVIADQLEPGDVVFCDYLATEGSYLGDTRSSARPQRRLGQDLFRQGRASTSGSGCRPSSAAVVGGAASAVPPTVRRLSRRSRRSPSRSRSWKCSWPASLRACFRSGQARPSRRRRSSDPGRWPGPAPCP